MTMAGDWEEPLPVRGLEAINNANGWSMAITGILVVFVSLIVLSVIISQMHRILALVERRGEGMSEKKASRTEAALTEAEIARRADHPLATNSKIDEVLKLWLPLIERLQDPFRLADLYQLAADRDMLHPHLTITMLRQEKIIVPVQTQGRMFTLASQLK